jgi:hypothetical protein
VAFVRKREKKAAVRWIKGLGMMGVWVKIVIF